MLEESSYNYGHINVNDFSVYSQKCVLILVDIHVLFSDSRFIKVIIRKNF